MVIPAKQNWRTSASEGRALTYGRRAIVSTLSGTSSSPATIKNSPAVSWPMTSKLMILQGARFGPGFALQHAHGNLATSAQNAPARHPAPARLRGSSADDRRRLHGVSDGCGERSTSRGSCPDHRIAHQGGGKSVC